MLKNIYLIRHGETDYNKRGMVQGRGVDAPLNTLGIEQSNAFHTYYRDLPIEKIYISSLQRTEQTVLPFLRKGIALEKHADLDEISWGIHEGKPFSDKAHQEYLYYTQQWRLGNTHLAIEGAETPQQVVARQKIFTQKLLESPEKNVLICSHGRAMRILLASWLNYPLSQMDIFEHHNASLYHLQHTGSMFSVLKYNDRKHFGA